MALFGKKPTLPAGDRDDLARHLGVRSVRVLAVARTPNGYAVALPDCLVVSGETGWARPLPWHELLRAGWSEDGTRLRWATMTAPHDEDGVDVVEPGDLPGVVAERIDQTIVARQAIELAPGKHASLIGRRPASGDHPVEWMMVPMGSTDLTRPDVREAAARILEQVRAEWA